MQNEIHAKPQPCRGVLARSGSFLFASAAGPREKQHDDGGVKQGVDGYGCGEVARLGIGIAVDATQAEELLQTTGDKLRCAVSKEPLQAPV